MAKTSLAQGAGRTSVDYVDPEIKGIPGDDLHLALADLVIAGHYDWIGGFLGVPGELWGTDLTFYPVSYDGGVELLFAREIVVPLGPDRMWRVRVGLDPGLLPYL